MAKQKSKIVKELDPKDVEGFSEARIKHYLSLGYRPYLDERSKVKWLTLPQFTMLEASQVKVPITHYIFGSKNKGRYRRRRHHGRFVGFVLRHWFFALLLLTIFAALAYIYFNQSVIF
jgi:hypothetical protein|nr:hypothetical protein [Candidatus Cloacimonadota bacterium]